MRTICGVVLGVLALTVVGAISHAQTTLQRETALEILKELTSRGRTTWISAGTIEAGHEKFRAAQTMNEAEIEREIEEELQDYQSRASKTERAAELQEMRLEAIPFNVRYELANEYTMRSHVVVKYDGDRFYWSIDVSSRSDSVGLPANLEGNSMTDQFRLEWNESRAYAWDGKEYTIFSRSANHATVDAAGKFAHAVNGPLTAGIIPWGSGALSYVNLSAGQVKATELLVDQAAQIHLTVEQIDGTLMDFILDPTKDYAALSWTVIRPSGTVTSTFCSGYEKVGGDWIPSTILIEVRDVLTDRLLRSDKWDFDRIDTTTPSADQFEVQYQPNTVVEYYSPWADGPTIYAQSNEADTKQLLAERLAYATNKQNKPQNCATATIQHATAQLGKPASPDELTQLVDAEGQTTMADMKRFVEQHGLHCRAVETNVATLGDLPTCQAILHVPSRNHFVALDKLDESKVWIVDLSQPKFYYRQDTASLPLEASRATALLVSNRPIPGPLNDIAAAKLSTIAGGSGRSCTRLLQDEYVEGCPGTNYDCYGVARIYYKRMGCEDAPTGTCASSWLPRFIQDDCIIRPETDKCGNEGGWETAYILACE